MDAMVLEKPTKLILMNHQQEGVDIAKERYYFAYFDDTGTGKTLMLSKIIEMKGLKTLVVCPRSVISTAWIPTIQKWFPELAPYTVNLWALWKKRKNRGVDFEREINRCRIGIINYESFKSQIQYIWNARFKIAVLDESSQLRDPKSTVSNIMIQYCDSVPHVFPACGTPAPNSYLEYFNQMRVMSKSIFGRSYYAHRNTYFRPPNTQAGEGYRWIMKFEMMPKFLRGLRSFSRSVFKKDVLDLPERTFNIRDVELSPTERKAHKDMKNKLYHLYKDVEFVAANAAVKIMKLREITAGFLKDETGQVYKLGDSKLKGLISLLEEIGNHQVLIGIQFHEEGDQIEEFFRKNDVKYGRYDGTVSDSQQDRAFEQFRKKEIQYLIGHPKSMGHGVDGLQYVCSYAIHYSISYSYDEDYQFNDRLYRHGQRNECTYYYLLAEKSIDPVIYQAIRRKEDASMAVLNYIKRG